MKQAIVTTSWDDGHIADLVLANLLAKYNLAATFYIAPQNHQFPVRVRLTKEQVRTLSDRFEVGAHTMTHPRLSALDASAASAEITDSKWTLENWTGKKVVSFCYPEGIYAPEHKQMVRDAGFSLARTVKRFAYGIGDDPFELPTTVHTYRHWSDVVPIVKEAGLAHFMKQYVNWDNLAIAMFEKAIACNGAFHLWGHSWEIDKSNDWDRLERVLRHISNHDNVNYRTNGQLIA